jgi:hypothetical protein
MQLSPEVEFWLRIASILVPSGVALLVPLITYLWLTRRLASYQTELSKELEDYKKDISRDLETHKLQLQANFQMRFYEFQTRYSLLHQKRAEAIEKLFELLAKVQNDLQIWASWERISHRETIEEFYVKTQDHFQNLVDFYDEKRIYFDEDIGTAVLNMVGTTQMLLDSHGSIENLRKSFPDWAESMKGNAHKIINQHIHPVMNQLVSRFKQILSADSPIAHIEKQ